jgi:hypothetical protein
LYLLPHRIVRGGEFVVPTPPEAKIQHKFGAWIVDLPERQESGAWLIA